MALLGRYSNQTPPGFVFVIRGFRVQPKKRYVDDSGNLIPLTLTWFVNGVTVVGMDNMVLDFANNDFIDTFFICETGSTYELQITQDLAGEGLTETAYDCDVHVYGNIIQDSGDPANFQIGNINKGSKNPMGEVSYTPPPLGGSPSPRRRRSVPMMPQDGRRPRRY